MFSSRFLQEWNEERIIDMRVVGMAAASTRLFSYVLLCSRAREEEKSLPPLEMLERLLKNWGLLSPLSCICIAQEREAEEKEGENGKCASKIKELPA